MAISEAKHTIVVFRVSDHRNQAASIYKEPGKDGEISCVVPDSCTFSSIYDDEPWDKLNQEALVCAGNKRVKIAEAFPNAKVMITALGIQQGNTSSGENLAAI